MRIKYIDVLKAFAIIAVVLYHSGIMEYGYLGVDIFLVISGYLTTKSLYKSLIINRPAGGYFTFELSRVFRLLPPLLFAGVCCMLVGYYVMLPDDYENLSQSVIATNFFGNNILSAITVMDYWNIANEYRPLMHTWYVGIVMQFYIVYPILFYLARFDKKNTKRTLLLIIGIFAVASLLIYFVTTNTASRFYYLPSRFFEFAVGGVVALRYNSNDKKPFKKGFAYVCYAALLSFLVINVEVIPSSLRLVAVVVLSCLLLCSQEVLENIVTGNVVLAKIGAASYSIFIWHQIFLAFYRYIITNKFTISSYIILLVLIVVLSWLSYHYVEQKITEVLKTKKGKQYVYSLTIVAYALLTIYSGNIYI